MRRVIAALLISTACSADRVTSADPVLAVAEEAWSGDTLVVRSTSFVGADTVPIVTVGEDTLRVWRGGRDTALVLLPDTAGAVELAVRLHHGGVAFTSVNVHGLRSAGPSPLVGYGSPYPFPWPGAGAPTALAVQQGRLVLMDFHSNTYRPLTPNTDLWSPECSQTFPNPVPSASDRRLVAVAHGCGPLEAVPITTDAPAADSGPPRAGLTQIHLSRGNWLVSYKNTGLQLLTRSPAGALVFAAKGEGSYVVSPRGDRVVPTQTIGGLFAFDPVAPALAFSLPLGYTGGAAFSEAGDTLYAVRSESSGVKLVALDATSGARLREVPVGSGELEVAVDPGRPWLYLAGVEGGFVTGQLVVYVYDRATFTRVATLRVPATAIPPNSSAPLAGVYVLILDPIRRQLYLTMNFFVDPEYVFRFDLMQ